MAKRSRREAVCLRKVSSTRTIARTALFAFLLPCIVHGPALTSATVFSEDLRALGDQSLLFWSTFDFSVDAALAYLGPIDSYLRGDDAPSQNCLDPHNSSPLACMGRGVDPTPFIDEFIESVDEMIGSVMKNLSQVFGPKEIEARPSSVLSQPIALPRGGGRQESPYSLFQKNDGSEKDPDRIPTRFLEMQGGDREKAKKAVEATLQWRKENDVDNILVKPHPNFEICKSVFPHYFLGRDKSGDVIFLQRPALIDFEKAKKNGVSKEDLLMHYIYVNEYLWQIMEGHKPTGTMTSVIDMTGVQLGMLRKKDLVQFLKLFVMTMDSHFPQRAHKTLLINAPKWAQTGYKLVSPLMRESTKAKIEIMSRGKKQDEALRKYLPKDAQDSLPASYWSKKDKKKRGKRRKEKVDTEEDEEQEQDAADNSTSFDTELERELRSYTLARLKEGGKKMTAVV